MRPDHVAFEIPDVFVVGYGLDYQDAYRHLPYVAVLDADDLAAGPPHDAAHPAHHSHARSLGRREAIGAAGRGLAARRVRRARLRAGARRAAGGRACSRRAFRSTVIGKQWKLDPAAWWRLRRHIQRAAARPRADLDVRGQRLWPRGGDARPACRRIVASERCVDPWKVVASTGDRSAGWPSAPTRSSSTAAACEEFYAQQGLPAEKFRLIPNGIGPAPASTLHARRSCWPSWGCRRHAADRRGRPAVAAKADQGPDLGHRPAAT